MSTYFWTYVLVDRGDVCVNQPHSKHIHHNRARPVLRSADGQQMDNRWTSGMCKLDVEHQTLLQRVPQDWHHTAASSFTSFLWTRYKPSADALTGIITNIFSLLFQCSQKKKESFSRLVSDFEVSPDIWCSAWDGSGEQRASLLCS